MTRRPKAATYEGYERDQYRMVRVGPRDLATVLDLGDKVYVTGTSEDGSARVTFADNRGPMTELLARVRKSAEPVATLIASAQVHREVVIAAPPGDGPAARPRPARSARLRRSAGAAARRGNERGHGD